MSLHRKREMKPKNIDEINYVLSNCATQLCISENIETGCVSDALYMGVIPIIAQEPALLYSTTFYRPAKIPTVSAWDDLAPNSVQHLFDNSQIDGIQKDLIEWYDQLITCQRRDFYDIVRGQQ